jgi:hypothetical protein
MNQYGTVDVTKWVVVEAAPLTASGHNEVVAAFGLKTDASRWARDTYGRRWRSRVSVVARGVLTQ